MNKCLLIFIFVFVQPVYSITKPNIATEINKDFIFLLNIDECVPCINNAYAVAKTLIEFKIPKQKIIFVLEQRNIKVLETNYVLELKNILDCSKLTILWNDKLYNQLKAVGKPDKNSRLLIFDRDKQVFVFNNLTKNVSSENILPYLN